MRLRRLFLRTSTIALPLGTLAACFGSSSKPPAVDAGAFDAAFGADGEASFDAPVDAAPLDILSAAIIDFGPVDCGGAAPPALTYTFTNSGTGALTYSASIDAASVFSIQGPASGNVPPGETRTLTIAASAIPATATAGQPLTGTLSLVTNVPSFTAVQVPLLITPQGGSLTLLPATVGFRRGAAHDRRDAHALHSHERRQRARRGDPRRAGRPRVLRRVHGLARRADARPGRGARGRAGELHADHGGPRPVRGRDRDDRRDVRVGRHDDPADRHGQHGARLDRPVAPGLRHGRLRRDGKANAVTIQNGYSFAITYAATLGLGTASPYTLDAATGSVAAGGKATIHVTPKAIPVPGDVTAGAYDDALTITTSAPGDTGDTIMLTESAAGAILSVTMGATAFASVPFNGSASLPFTVTNDGNLGAPVTVAATGAGYSAAFSPASPTVAAGGGTADGSATYTPQSASGGAGSITVTTTAPQCGPAPAAVSLSATVSAPKTTVSGATVSFDVTCGMVGASATQNVSVTNSGTAPLAISNVASSSARFKVVSAPATIAAGAASTIQVEAVAPVVGTDAAGTYTASLTFNTDELGTPTYTVPLSVTIHGANLAFTPGSTIDFSTVCSNNNFVTYGVKNTGNEDATVTGPTNPQNSSSQEYQTSRFCGLDPANDCLGEEPRTNGTFEQPGGAVVQAGATVNDAINEYDEFFSSVADAPCTGTDEFTYTATGDICVPLPTLVYNFDYGAFTTCSCT